MSDYAEEIQDLRMAILLLEEKIDTLSDYCLNISNVSRKINESSIKAFLNIAKRLDRLEDAQKNVKQ